MQVIKEANSRPIKAWVGTKTVNAADGWYQLMQEALDVREF